MYGISPFLLLLSPLLSQLIFGTKALTKSTKLNFAKVAFINFLLQIIFSYLVYNYLEHKLTAESNGQIKCGMPFVALIFGELFIFGVLLLIIFVQYLLKRFYNRNQK